MKQKWLKISIYMSVFVSVFLGIGFIESKTNILSKLHTFLYLKEINNGVISYSYITIAIAIISLSAIVFTIVIGMMQYLVNEISYQTYDNRVLKNKSAKHIFLVFMSISTFLIGLYLFGDISALPITYCAVILMVILVITKLILTLYSTLFEDFSIYSLMENNHKEILNIYDDLKKEEQNFIRLKNRIENSGKNVFVKFRIWLDVKELKRMSEMVKPLKEKYLTTLDSVSEELNFIVSNACRREDYRFLKTSLEYVTRLGIHRFSSFGVGLKKHHQALWIGYN